MKYSKASEFDLDQIYLVDKMFLKGLSADRSKNGSNFDYTVVTDNERLGLKGYVHKYHLGMQRYYFRKQFNESLLAKMTDEEFEKNPQDYYYRERKIREEASKQRKEMLEKSFGLLLRTTM